MIAYHMMTFMHDSLEVCLGLEFQALSLAVLPGEPLHTAMPAFRSSSRPATTTGSMRIRKLMPIYELSMYPHLLTAGHRSCTQNCIACLMSIKHTHHEEHICQHAEGVMLAWPLMILPAMPLDCALSAEQEQELYQVEAACDKADIV